MHFFYSWKKNLGTRSDNKKSGLKAFMKHSLLFIFVTGNSIWKCICYVSSRRVNLSTCRHAWDSHSVTINISHLNNAVVICQAPLSVSSPRIRVGLMLRCDRPLSWPMHLSAHIYAHTACVVDRDGCPFHLSIQREWVCVTDSQSARDER